MRAFAGPEARVHLDHDVAALAAARPSAVSPTWWATSPRAGAIRSTASKTRCSKARPLLRAALVLGRQLAPRPRARRAAACTSPSSLRSFSSSPSLVSRCCFISRTTAALKSASGLWPSSAENWRSRSWRDSWSSLAVDSLIWCCTAVLRSPPKCCASCSASSLGVGVERLGHRAAVLAEELLEALLELLGDRRARGRRTHARPPRTPARTRCARGPPRRRWPPGRAPARRSRARRDGLGGRDIALQAARDELDERTVGDRPGRRSAPRRRAARRADRGRECGGLLPLNPVSNGRPGALTERSARCGAVPALAPDVGPAALLRSASPAAAALTRAPARPGGSAAPPAKAARRSAASSRAATRTGRPARAGAGGRSRPRLRYPRAPRSRYSRAGCGMSERWSAGPSARPRRILPRGPARRRLRALVDVHEFFGQPFRLRYRCRGPVVPRRTRSAPGRAGPTAAAALGAAWSRRSALSGAGRSRVGGPPRAGGAPARAEPRFGGVIRGANRSTRGSRARTGCCVARVVRSVHSVRSPIGEVKVGSVSC